MPPAGAMPMGQGNVVPFPGGGAQPHPMMGGMGMPPPLPPQPPGPEEIQILIHVKILKAIDLLRKDVTREYRIDIETDSTIFGDKYQDRQDVNEFMTSLATYMKGFEAIAANSPEAMPMLAKALQWSTRRYRVGRDLESEIDNFVTLMTKKAKQLAENPQPSPEQAKANSEKEIVMMEAKAQEANDQREDQRQQANDQRQAMLDQSKAQQESQKMQQEMQMKREEMQMEMRKAEMEMQMKREEHQIKMMELKAGIQAKQQEHAMDAHQQSQEMQMDMQKSSMELQQSHEEHQVNKEVLEHKASTDKKLQDQKLQHGEDKHKQAMTQAKQKAKQQPKKKAS
jgi:hypothetical protein